MYAMVLSLCLFAAPANSEEVEKLCLTKQEMYKRFSNGNSLSMTVTMYGLVGYCQEKHQTYKAAIDRCISDGIPMMLIGMEKAGYATNTEIENAKQYGLAAGKRLFHEGAEWVDIMKSEIAPKE